MRSEGVVEQVSCQLVLSITLPYSFSLLSKALQILVEQYAPRGSSSRSPTLLCRALRSAVSRLSIALLAVSLRVALREGG